MNREEQHAHARAAIERIFQRAQTWLSMGSNVESAINCLCLTGDEVNRTLLELDKAQREATLPELLQDEAQELTTEQTQDTPEGA